MGRVRTISASGSRRRSRSRTRKSRRSRSTARARSRSTRTGRRSCRGRTRTSENHNIIQPTPISDIFNDPIILQPSSPYYPTAFLTEYAPSHVGNPVNVRYRAVLNGNRDITDKNEAWQIVGGVEGSWKNWDINVAGFYNETEVKETLNGGFRSCRCWSRC